MAAAMSDLCVVPSSRSGKDSFAVFARVAIYSVNNHEAKDARGFLAIFNKILKMQVKVYQEKVYGADSARAQSR
jgi:hypothetical protein